MSDSSNCDGKNDYSSNAQFDRWSHKLRLITGLGLKSDDEKREWLNSRCNAWRDQLFESSPMVRYLLQHLSVLPIPTLEKTIPSENQPMTSQSDNAGPSTWLPIPIECGICSPVRSAGLFSPFPPSTGGQVKLCSDGLASKSHMEDVLSHELIHAWDHRRFKLDWGNLQHVACTEIRANALSGDCRWLREIDRHNFKFAKQRQFCARRRAILSVADHVKPSSEGGDSLDPMKVAEEVVDQVWASCWNDTRPFDEIY
ncbi:mitochondrial inner membrane peptidase Atp23 [Phakopsora pachyrhizi]|uniref:Mitochondrial inner membrane protease ATP23 n=1 Tax=Phakopsora pachyrhizi TaxID=170000 RepID=A0AAV0AKJ6_PHAPC|nr:mitochondrial inner membrane peptidase Atp23 [Phakopsora pachyrhizi]CAH7668156.1 mitochondrial inner membrane peptidase Atp23 [Phakopsora pachyrhizi]